MSRLIKFFSRSRRTSWPSFSDAYADTGLEKHSLYLRLLLPRLTGRVTKDPIDFSAVELTHIKQTRSGDHSLDLDAETADSIDPAGAGGTGAAQDYYLARPEMRGRLVQLLGALVHENAQGEGKTA